MRTQALLLAFACTIGSLFSTGEASELNEDIHLVLQLEVGDMESRDMIYALLKNDDQIQVVNSCDILNLVVLAPKPGVHLEKSQLRAYLHVKNNAEGKVDFQVLEDLTAMDVLYDCRAALQESLDTE